MHGGFDTALLQICKLYVLESKYLVPTSKLTVLSLESKLILEYVSSFEFWKDRSNPAQSSVSYSSDQIKSGRGHQNQNIVLLLILLVFVMILEVGLDIFYP